MRYERHTLYKRGEKTISGDRKHSPRVALYCSAHESWGMLFLLSQETLGWLTNDPGAESGKF